MSTGYADIVIGLQYGDEGKARVVDMLAKEYDIIARFNGGANAGHSIETEDGRKLALNQVPSGVFYPEKTLYTGSGCVVDFAQLSQEVAGLEAQGLNVKDRYRIAAQASVVQPHHFLIDGATGKSVGTTKKGIGPCYADRASRMLGERLTNIRAGDLLDNPEKMFEAMRANWAAVAESYGADAATGEAWITRIREGFEALKECIERDPLFLEKKARNGARILFEGAQSVLLDVTKGYVPYVTSSNTVAAAAFTGGDLPPRYHRKTLGIAKAVMSRVGHGPFPSEFGGSRSEAYCMQANPDGSPTYGRKVEEAYDIDALMKSTDGFEMGKAMRVLSREYGTVSTRPRRIGSLDLAALEYAIRMNGVDELFITKCDLLREYTRTLSGKMPVTVGYSLDGSPIDYVPATTEQYSKVSPIIQEWDIAGDELTEVRQVADLPESVQAFLKAIEDRCQTRVMGIGVGPQRNQVVFF